MFLNWYIVISNGLDELGRHDLLEFLVENVDYDGDSYFIPSALMRSYLEIQESRS